MLPDIQSPPEHHWAASGGVTSGGVATSFCFFELQSIQSMLSVTLLTNKAQILSEKKRIREPNVS